MLLLGVVKFRGRATETVVCPVPCGVNVELAVSLLGVIVIGVVIVPTPAVFGVVVSETVTEAPPCKGCVCTELPVPSRTAVETLSGVGPAATVVSSSNAGWLDPPGPEGPKMMMPVGARFTEALLEVKPGAAAL